MHSSNGSTISSLSQSDRTWWTRDHLFEWSPAPGRFPLSPRRDLARGQRSPSFLPSCRFRRASCRINADPHARIAAAPLPTSARARERGSCSLAGRGVGHFLPRYEQVGQCLGYAAMESFLCSRGPAAPACARSSASTQRPVHLGLVHPLHHRAHHLITSCNPFGRKQNVLVSSIGCVHLES